MSSTETMRPTDEDELTGDASLSCELVTSSSAVCLENTDERRTSCGLPMLSLGRRLVASMVVDGRRD